MGNLDGLGFSGSTYTELASSDGGNSNNETSFMPKKTKAKPKPSMLSPAEQLAALDERRQNLAQNRTTKQIAVNLALEDYRKIVDMAEKEFIGGSMATSFSFYIAWCLKVGIKYYEKFGLSHNNPDRINFEQQHDQGAPRDYSQGSPKDAPSRPSNARTFSSFSDALRGGKQLEEASYSSQVHPTLGRATPVNRYIPEVHGGDQMSPAPKQEDLDLEAQYMREFEASDDNEHTPWAIEGGDAFSPEALQSVKAFLPASTSIE